MSDQAGDPYCRDDPHHFVSTHARDFPIWIVQCSLCGFFNSDDMNMQLSAYVTKEIERQSVNEGKA